ncbi:SA1362 family protein [Aquibacillus rhizosphaerae]|uniref:SA1362 family protein n=1 Tax=Aquibacillus rhizosphaerae TaxID=3051431 RepID=A0ABT7L6W8_9BACI|nr:SA1362 family protein [Aquibacillus sp. LR5S19]MDL4841576.1 SA1362 family protein [Aquibacillus sp. LR5S19]
MIRHKLSLLIYVLIGLAIFGFAFNLLTNTTSLLMNLFIMVAVGALIYGAVYYFFLRKRSSNDLKKYKKAVKQSKMKYKSDRTGNKTHTQAVKKQKPLLNKRKQSNARATHLRVIEGNKQKRKNRASF